MAIKHSMKKSSLPRKSNAVFLSPVKSDAELMSKTGFKAIDQKFKFKTEKIISSDLWRYLSDKKPKLKNKPESVGKNARITKAPKPAGNQIKVIKPGAKK